MRRLTLILTLVVAASAFAAPAEKAKKKTAPATAARLSVPPIEFKHRKLPNGLELYSAQDRSTPTVAIQVWYRVGSKDDPEGRSGFAHLFEHIMFKSTKNMPSEMLDRLTEDVGGWNNATTFDDTTPYYEVVPSNYLETLIWAEAERMGSLTVDEANFKSEREVVKEEFRRNYLAAPYGRLVYAMEVNTFAVHPYRRPGIGRMEDLDAASIEDVRAFHATYYRPDNAVLIVAGDFEQEQLDKWVDQYFGAVPKPDTPIPRVTVKEPVREKAKRVVEHGPNVPLPAVAITWLAPPAASADAQALNVLAAILGKGESSRLYQQLVYRSQIAQEIDARADLRQDLGVFSVLAIMASEHDAREGEKALQEQLIGLLRAPIPSSELEKAKNLLITDALRERETNNGKAFALGQAIIFDGDAAEVNRSVDKLQAVTSADIHRVLKKYVTEARPVVIHYEAAAETKTEGGSQQ